MKVTQVGKQNAYIIEGNNCRVLQSYDQIVALEAPNGKYYRTDKQWSVTTSKHINKFVGGAKRGEPCPQSVLDTWDTGEHSAFAPCGENISG